MCIVCVWVLWRVCIGVHNKFVESILLCFYMSSGDWTQVSRLYQHGQPQIVFWFVLFCFDKDIKIVQWENKPFKQVMLKQLSKCKGMKKWDPYFASGINKTQLKVGQRPKCKT